MCAGGFFSFQKAFPGNHMAPFFGAMVASMGENLITNGVLTLLRFPEHLERLRREPAIAPRLIEELLRYEPPVHYRTRLARADIAIGGTTIPEGAPVVLLLASGSRDPLRFADPDRFDPDRANNQHFGFGGSLHYCVGAPLARIEAELEARRTLRFENAAKDVPPLYRGMRDEDV